MQTGIGAKPHPVVSREEWTRQRVALLAEEKKVTRFHDELARKRREMPWVKVDQNYTFDTPKGKRTLAELFNGRSQLVVYHFMLGPDWKEGCPSCSYIADHLDGAAVHLAARDVTLTMISRAPLDKIEGFKKRMGWRFNWASSFGTSFNADFGVTFSKAQMEKGPVLYNFTMQEFPSEEAPGLSVFFKDERGEVFHNYSTYSRGLDALLGAYVVLDMTPKGRDEAALPHSMAWVRHHDKYGTNEFADADQPYWPKIESAEDKGSCGCGCEEKPT